MQRKISEVISQRELVSIAPTATVREAAVLMGKGQIGCLPVVVEGKLVGIFTERDALTLVLACSVDPSVTTIQEVMTPNPQCIGSEKPLAHALIRMYEGGFRHMPVVDSGRLVGVVAVRDALGPELSDLDSQLQQFQHIAEHIA